MLLGIFGIVGMYTLVILSFVLELKRLTIDKTLTLEQKKMADRSANIALLLFCLFYLVNTCISVYVGIKYEDIGEVWAIVMVSLMWVAGCAALYWMHVGSRKFSKKRVVTI